MEHLSSGASFFQVKSAPQMGPQPSCPICHQGAVQTTAQDGHSVPLGPGSCIWYLCGQSEPTLKCVGPFGSQPFFIPKVRGGQQGGESAKGGPGERLGRGPCWSSPPPGCLTPSCPPWPYVSTPLWNQLCTPSLLPSFPKVPHTGQTHWRWGFRPQARVGAAQGGERGVG